MVTTTDGTPHLEESLRRMADLLPRLSEADWNRDQNGKWSLAQEVSHILLATQRTAQLFGQAARPLWYANARPSRSYEALRDEYLAALAANVGIKNAATAPSDDVRQTTPAGQLAAWQSATETLLGNVVAVPEADLDGFTVWKHPLLGPLTGREMVYFTSYHTRHHEASLRRKMGEA